MRPYDGLLTGSRMAREWLTRARRAVRSAPLPVRVLLMLVLLALVVLASELPARVADVLLLAALLYGPVAVWRGHRSVAASIGVAIGGMAAILLVAALTPPVTV